MLEKLEKCAGWVQELERCEETIQNSPTAQVPFEGKLKGQMGNLGLFLSLLRIRALEVF